jgi:predicted RNase H-like HicB family nuclease/uncharacterized damage-inducible protein DinB
MKKYSLYIESGPRQRTTMIHVIDLLGCIARGATTEEAIEATPEAIRAYLQFLRQHGEKGKPDAPFTTVVIQHVMEGSWIGYGDPASGFKPDFEPLSAKDLTIYLKRLTWLQSELIEIVRDAPLKQLRAEPKTGGRSIHRILDHVAESHAVYLRYLVGKVDGLSDALKALKNPADASDALARVWQISNSRLQTLTEKERAQQVPHGQVTWTARRALRRMLEHHWEHLHEARERLA